jgi:hypothetical protein
LANFTFMKNLLLCLLVLACKAPSETKSTPDAALIARGTLLEVEDAGYPLGYLRILTEGDTTRPYFDINFEEVPDGGLEQLKAKIGQKLSFAYSKDQVPTLVDIQAAGKSIFPNDPVELQPFTKRITGVLSGAAETTPGDLPSQISVLAADGTKLDLDYFVTPDLVAQNGKTVTLYYEIQDRQTVKLIK